MNRHECSLRGALVGLVVLVSGCDVLCPILPGFCASGQRAFLMNDVFLSAVLADQNSGIGVVITPEWGMFVEAGRFRLLHSEGYSIHMETASNGGIFYVIYDQASDQSVAIRSHETASDLIVSLYEVSSSFNPTSQSALNSLNSQNPKETVTLSQARRDRSKSSRTWRKLEECGKLDFGQGFADCVQQSFKDMAADQIDRITNGLLSATERFRGALGEVASTAMRLSSEAMKDVSDFLRSGAVDATDAVKRSIDFDGLIDSAKGFLRNRAISTGIGADQDAVDQVEQVYNVISPPSQVPPTYTPPVVPYVPYVPYVPPTYYPPTYYPPYTPPTTPPTSGSCPPDGWVYCNCAEKHGCIGSYCDGALYHPDGVYCDESPCGL